KKRSDIVFGVARRPRNQGDGRNGVALISLTQLRKKSVEKSKFGEMFKLRVSKEAIHELGHTFGLSHCENECVMRYSNNLYEADKKPSTFCEICFSRLYDFFNQIDF
ncbi:MAG: hypothetical protein EU521_01195, partial [Promethearchaeota archaeon]